MKVLVIRNDKLGDFMLSLPSFALLKQQCPQAELVALVPEYTREMAEACPSIDRVLIDPGKAAGVAALTSALKAERFDAVITLYSTTRVGLACFLARIPYRLAPATKLAQLFYNRRLTQRRSRSEKPEYRYNQELVERFLKDHERPTSPQPAPPYLQFDKDEVSALRQEFCRSNGIDESHRLLFLHPGSGGSANNLSLVQYAELIKQLHNDTPFTVVISAGPGEEQKARELQQQLGTIRAVLYASHTGLSDFARHIQFADLFISGSTGPLHIAGALDVPTAAFYPTRRSATALRWQTLNSEGRRLAFSPPPGEAESEMQHTDLAAAAETISRTFLC